MTTSRKSRRWGRIPWGVLGVVVGLAGCSERRVGPAMLANERLGPMVIAVAPALNLSGGSDFDPNQFADLMASELSQVEDVGVVPVSRVLGVLAVQGLDAVESPDHALELTRLLGANAILVFAVTEYDPYDPPIIGISAQLYGARPRAGGQSLDPVSLSRQGRLTASGSGTTDRRILGRTQRVFDASHAAVVAEIREFAQARNAGESPYGWRKYVVSQRNYIRFCCHSTIRTLVSGCVDPVLAEITTHRIPILRVLLTVEH